MKRSLALVLSLILSGSLVNCGNLVNSEIRSADQGVTPAQSLHRFLLNHGVLNTPARISFSEDLQRLYSLGSVEKPEGCPLRSFKDQPDSASENAVNIFTAEETSI